MRHTITLAGKQRELEVTPMRVACFERVADKPFHSFDPQRVSDLVDFLRAFLVPTRTHDPAGLVGVRAALARFPELTSVSPLPEFAGLRECESLIALGNEGELQVECFRVFCIARGKPLSPAQVAELRADAGLPAAPGEVRANAN